MRILYNQVVLDTAGIVASAICAVHCLFLPLLFSFSTFSSFVFLDDPLLENSVLVVSAVLGVSSLFPSYLKQHRKLIAIVILMFGFLIIGLSRFKVNVNEAVLTAAGATFVASAHFVNYRLSKKWHS